MISRDTRIVMVRCTKCGATTQIVSKGGKDYSVCPRCGGKEFEKIETEVITK